MTREQTSTRSVDLDRYVASAIDIGHITALVAGTRPGWPSHLVATILTSIAPQVTAADLAVAALRAAQNFDLRTPKAIGWRGPHWDGAKTQPVETQRHARCGVCGKTEPRCVMERPGRDDDHNFEPTRSTA